MSEDLRSAALDYHRRPAPGKLEVVTTKPMETQRDLSLAYSPGVAAACEAIAEEAGEAASLTSRQNLVGVVTNGTAVLGLGNIGPLASKPVMEGKAALFKKFAGIDVFDIEVAETEPEMFIETVARLEPTFGGINLEDIKAPECFIIEKALRERMKIPVFHDDQHGTAIIAAAAVMSGLKVAGKRWDEVKLVSSGAGAAALACLNLLVTMGIRRENITVTDRFGVAYKGRKEEMDPWKEVYCQDTDARTLDDVIGDADIFLGLSAPNVLKPDMVKRMAEQPLILALANPTPEIMPEVALEARSDVIMATGRSDYPNQVNNVLCFPFIFRGALDVGATTINEEMKAACVKALTDLAMLEPSERVTKQFSNQGLRFGREYLIPKPFDHRLLIFLAPAVARAAMDSGVATKPIEDMDAYTEKLRGIVYRTRSVMRPVFEKARKAPQRLVYAEGEGRRVLQAAQQVADDGIAHPILVGRPEVIQQRIEQLGLRLQPGKDCEVVNLHDDERYGDYWRLYHEKVRRLGISMREAQTIVRSDETAVAAVMLARGEADAMLCGSIGKFETHLRQIRYVIGKRAGVRDLSTVTALILPSGPLFLCDTHVTPEPTAKEIVEMTLLAATEVRAFGIKPKVALLSRSNFGSHANKAALKMSEAALMLHERAPDLEIEGEMHAELALSERVRRNIFGESRLTEGANLPDHAERRCSPYRLQPAQGARRRRGRGSDPHRSGQDRPRGDGVRDRPRTGEHERGKRRRRTAR